MAMQGNMDVSIGGVGIGAAAAAPGQVLPVLRAHHARQGRPTGSFPWPYDSRNFGGVPHGLQTPTSF